MFNTNLWVIPGTHPMSCNCYQYWPATKYGKYLGSAPQFDGLVERKVMISFQDNGNFLVPLTSSKKTERKKLLLSTMLKDHVGQGGQNRYNLKRDEDAFRFQYSCHAFHIMDRVVFKRKMEWMANSLKKNWALSITSTDWKHEIHGGKTSSKQKLVEQSFHTLEV